MKAPWAQFLSELIGTALLVAVGLSVVIVDFGAQSPVAAWLPTAGARRLVTGFLFGATGGLIALSPVGQVSGAHVNPAVTVAFWLMGKMRGWVALGYVGAQLVGALLGALPLLAWGEMGASVEFGASLPGPGYGTAAVLLGEFASTLALIVGLFFFLGHRRTRAFTPLLLPILFAALVYLEGPVSGTSTNPARSLGPAVMAGDWRDWWVYWTAPLLGALAMPSGDRGRQALSLRA